MDAIRRLETLVRQLQGAIPTLVDALPASGYDGQEVYYVADATNGVVWHLRYREAASGSYKWEVVGGPPLFAEVVTGETTTSTSYANLATTGPSVTVPLAGDYDVAVGAMMNNSGANASAVSYAIGAAAAQDADGARHDGTNYASVCRVRRKAGLAASTALVAKYVVGGGTGDFHRRWLSAAPVRVG